VVTNLPAEAKKKWFEVTLTRNPEERIRLMQEFLSLVPKHKGTDKMCAHVKRQISQLRQEVEHRKRVAKRGRAPSYFPEKAGAALVKTTTGVRTQYLLEMTPDPRGAVLEDINLMRRVLKPEVKIKASGGIYTLDFALDLIRAGADQLGMSQGEKVIREFEETYGEGVELR